MRCLHTGTTLEIILLFTKAKTLNPITRQECENLPLGNFITFSPSVNKNKLAIAIASKIPIVTSGKLGLQICKVSELANTEIPLNVTSISEKCNASGFLPIPQSMLPSAILLVAKLMEECLELFLHGEAQDRIFFLPHLPSKDKTKMPFFNGASLYVMTPTPHGKPALSLAQYESANNESDFYPPVIHFGDYFAFCINL